MERCKNYNAIIQNPISKEKENLYLLPIISSKSDGEAVDGEKTAYERG
jgi:hypothetical protein